MPDTGENREIRQRINAKEAEIELEETKLLQKSTPLPDRTSGTLRRAAKKQKEVKGRLRRDS
jgi:hypothetical protein